MMSNNDMSYLIFGLIYIVCFTIILIAIKMEKLK